MKIKMYEGLADDFIHHSMGLNKFDYSKTMDYGEFLAEKFNEFGFDQVYGPGEFEDDGGFVEVCGVLLTNNGNDEAYSVSVYFNSPERAKANGGSNIEVSRYNVTGRGDPELFNRFANFSALLNSNLFEIISNEVLKVSDRLEAEYQNGFRR